MPTTPVGRSLGEPLDELPDVATSPAVAPPVRWLLVAAGWAAVALVLGGRSGPAPWIWLAGWAAGGMLCIGSLAIFVLVDTRRRTSPWYAVRRPIARLHGALVLIGVLAVALNAWRFADWASRR